MGLSSVPPASESGLWSKSGTDPGSRTDEAGASHRWQIGRGVEDGPRRLEEDESRSSLGGGEGRRPSSAEVSPEADRGAGRSQEEAAWPGAILSGIWVRLESKPGAVRHCACPAQGHGPTRPSRAPGAVFFADGSRLY
ncbi:hypothetical protein IscW_ISCW011427 [Ixodes scapularis]|uniref:Uncharacterized protein n=1 Tax=Ixodes scapularis TaxID=6945 RepID=B7Q538_IXOSC|nr:hypothetical protein IscW_ISCW011427 [Ixodes scapularis]|eukprot:XP_002411675.1 hypothetical protein IscW_ISCW011427 [Ixodes scapularis]